MDTTGSHRCHRSGRSVPRRARPGLDERRGRARNRLLRVAPFWHRHLWHNINGLWRWRQNGASPPLRIYGAISERYEPKWLTGDRVRCTLFRNCSTTSIWGWRSAISAPIVAPVRQAANYVHCHRNPDTTGSHRCHRSGCLVPLRAHPGVDGKHDQARNPLLRGGAISAPALMA